MRGKRSARNTLTVDQRAIPAAEVADPPQTVDVTAQRTDGTGER